MVNATEKGNVGSGGLRVLEKQWVQSSSCLSRLVRVKFSHFQLKESQLTVFLMSSQIPRVSLESKASI